MKTIPVHGYTLLELIVSVGVFSLVMLAATGAYLSLITLDQKARAVNDVVNNLTFGIDSMARAIRTGTEYDCDPDSGGANCTGTPGDSFGFQDSESPSREVVYALENNQIIAYINDVPFPVTDPRISIEDLDFYVRGVGVGDGVQPQVVFMIRGTMNADADTETSFTIQTSATQRYLEL